ncbi:MAG: hypothetical protein GEV08_25660, partial [Acidimicrobiia bacterium]|nr:hypothetical protein [Acidimicrobiia bacterium]
MSIRRFTRPTGAPLQDRLTTLAATALAAIATWALLSLVGGIDLEVVEDGKVDPGSRRSRSWLGASQCPVERPPRQRLWGSHRSMMAGELAAGRALSAVPLGEQGYGRAVDDADIYDEHIDEEADEAASHAERERSAVAELERILLAEGPRDLDELTAAFAEHAPGLADDLLAGRPGADLPAQLSALAQRADEIWRLPDGRLAPVLHHLHRATFTHRLTAGELERQAIDLLPDLVALAFPRAFTLRDGTDLTTAGPEDRRAADGGSLLGPEGWLAS